MNWLKLAPQFSCSPGAIYGRPVTGECVRVCREITFARGVASGRAKSHRNASRFTFEMPFRGHVACVRVSAFFPPCCECECVCVVHLLHAVLHFYVSHTHTQATIQADRQTGCPAASPLSQYNSRRRCRRRRRRCCRRLCGGCSPARVRCRV